MDFEKTGVPGLDEILKGGFKKNASILVKGGPGTGKTILTLQFIIQGAKQGQPSIFITAEQELDNLRRNAKSLGMDLEKYEKKGLIYLIKQPITLKKLITISTPLELMREKKVKRVALDSLNFLRYSIEEEIGYRKEILDLITNMKNVLFLATAEEKEEGIDFMTYSSEDYLFDGIIKLIKIRKGSNFERCVFIVKMRNQYHSINIFPLIIAERGITIYTKEIPFSLVEKEFEK